MRDTSSIRVESDRVAFDFANGKSLKLPAHYGTFHDQNGIVLPKCEVFFGPWKKTKQPAKMDRSQRRYFGADHKAFMAKLPQIPVDGWKKVGDVVMIYYVRRGTRAPDGFHHPYKSKSPTLYKCGRLYKLALGDGCLVDDRGYVFP